MSDAIEPNDNGSETPVRQSPPPPPDAMRVMISEIVRDLVAMPDAVRVEEHEREEEGDRFQLFELHVDPSDLGKVIGKNGRTARALRAMVNALAARMRIQAELEIIEPDRPEGNVDEIDTSNADTDSDEGDDEDDGDNGDEGPESDA